MTTTRTQIRDLRQKIRSIRRADKKAQHNQSRNHEKRQMNLSIATTQLEHLTGKPQQPSL